MPAYCFTDEIIGLKAQWEAAIKDREEKHDEK
jgi:hypothetical protein